MKAVNENLKVKSPSHTGKGVCREYGKDVGFDQCGLDSREIVEESP